MVQTVSHGAIIDQEGSLGKCASKSGLADGVLIDGAIVTTTGNHCEGARNSLTVDDKSGGM